MRDEGSPNADVLVSFAASPVRMELSHKSSSEEAVLMASAALLRQVGNLRHLRAHKWLHFAISLSIFQLSCTQVMDSYFNLSIHV